jgi:hypothetical protein
MTLCGTVGALVREKTEEWTFANGSPDAHVTPRKWARPCVLEGRGTLPRVIGFVNLCIEKKTESGSGTAIMVSAERRAMMAGAAEFFANLYELPKPVWVDKPKYASACCAGLFETTSTGECRLQ